MTALMFVTVWLIVQAVTIVWHLVEKPYQLSNMSPAYATFALIVFLFQIGWALVLIF